MPYEVLLTAGAQRDLEALYDFHRQALDRLQGSPARELLLLKPSSAPVKTSTSPTISRGGARHGSNLYVYSNPY